MLDKCAPSHNKWLTYLLVHVALVVLPGPGGLVHLSLTVHRVVHQDETP
jgi:threonine/homoserine/homoserine lactone efflux protein